MRILLIHNPSAGSSADNVTEVIGLMKRAGHDVDYCPDQGAWQTALDQKPDLVVVMGGDGTVANIARLVPSSPPPLAVLPVGTANNIATRLGLTELPLSTLVAGWTGASRQAFDVGVARGPWGEFRFLESVGAGLISDTIATIDDGWASHVNAIADQERRISRAFDVFRHTVLEMPSSYYELRLDGRDLSGEYLLVEAMNFGLAGPNLHLSPHADYHDGLLDLVLVPPRDRTLLHQQLEQFRADPASAPTLRVHRGRSVQLRCDGCRVHLDDELLDPADGMMSMELSVDRGALTFLLPKAP